MITFENPTNHYQEKIALPELWCLLFGPFYFAWKGIWGHAGLSAIAAACTAGISWFLYPLFARSAVAKHYRRRGWVELDARPAAEQQLRKQQTWGFVLIAVIIIMAIGFLHG